MQPLLHRVKSVVMLICALLLTQATNAQLQIITPDTTICPNTSVDLTAVSTGTTATPLSLTDDLYTGVVPLGFSFNFFGNTYTDCVISSNGYISFNTSNANQFSPWAIGSGIPGNTAVYNSICGFYADILPMPGQGTLDYSTLGTAPNRKFVVSFCDVPMFSCTSLITSFQIILYETTNEIEVHIANAPSCPAWNNGYAIEGVQNSTGTIAFAVPGRNYPTVWSATHSSHRFTPTSTTSYTITAIPYAPVPNAGSIISWYENGVNFLGTGGTITVSPIVNTYYVAEVTKCQDTLRDTVNVYIGGGPTITNISSTNPTTCGGSDGTITLYGMDPNQIYDLHYNKNGNPQTPISVTSNISGEVTMVNLTAGTYDNLVIYKGLCFSNTVGPVTLTDPPVIADYNYVIHFGCNGDTVIFTNNSIQNTFNTWDFGDGTGDTAANPTHIYPVQGNYIVKLIVSNGICKDSSIQVVNTLHPIVASFTVDDDSACTNQLINFTNTSIATNPSFFWDFGDGTPTTTLQDPTHAYNAPGTYRVMMVVSDLVPCQDTAYMNILVDTIPDISFVVSDSVLCEGQGVHFEADYLQTGNTGLLWEFGDGNFILNEPGVSHAYDSSGTYTIKVTAAYRNCPSVDATKDITIRAFPAIDLGKDTTMCPNGEPLVIGDYKNAGSGASWQWNTGETSAYISVRHPGIYTARVTMNGCETSDSIEVFKDCYIDIPNSFTPNGDGLNDYFLPRQLLSKSLTGFKMTIYNRWGQEIFQTDRIDGRGWDGRFNEKEQPTGVYVYIIDAVINGNSREHYEGNVTLLR